MDNLNTALEYADRLMEIKIHKEVSRMSEKSFDEVTEYIKKVGEQAGKSKFFDFIVCKRLINLINNEDYEQEKNNRKGWGKSKKELQKR